MAYTFINDFIAEKTPPGPFPIPQLRFVWGAIAYSEKPLNGTPASGASSGTSHRAAKYIRNGLGEAVPLQDEDEPGYDIGLFLCFIQHVQFIHTHGQA